MAGEEAFVRCLESVLAHTDAPVLVPAALAPHAARRVRAVEGDGAAALCTAAGRADVALLDGTAVVGAGWLEGLAAGAGEDGIVATVSATTLGAGPAGLHRTRREHPADRTPDELAAALRRAAGDARARIPAPANACVLVMRTALDACGPFDDGFAARCSAHGLVHVAAGGVLAYPVADDARAPAPPDPRGALAPEPASRLIVAAQRAADGLTVTIDARILTSVITGTQVQALELIAALRRTGAVALRAVVPPDLGAHAREALGDVELLAADELPEHTRRSVVVHRPYQLSSASDFALLRRLGHRLVVTHLDLMGYDVAAYHPDEATWQAYRRLTREALATADAVVTLSRHVAAGIAAEGLGDPARVHAVALGVDHRIHGLLSQPRRPSGVGALGDRPFLLCLGTDLRHKHRRFALALLRALRERHGWEGALVLAGPQLPYGSSQPDEAAARLEHPDLADDVVSLAAIDEAAKAWLVREAAAVVYPTLREGFGLVPAEAAAVGTPCLFAPQSALAELYPADLARLVPWDAEASADASIAVLRDPAAADELVGALREHVAELTWDRCATELVGVYEGVVRGLPRHAATLAWDALETGARLEAAEAELARRPPVDAIGRLLVGPDGLLPDDAQRTLAGLARRGPTRRLLLATLRSMRRLVVGDGG
jgi:glycosyltransferase involved in cell wall biosynthesis